MLNRDLLGAESIKCLLEREASTSKLYLERATETSSERAVMTESDALTCQCCSSKSVRKMPKCCI